MSDDPQAQAAEILERAGEPSLEPPATHDAEVSPSPQEAVTERGRERRFITIKYHPPYDHLRGWNAVEPRVAPDSKMAQSPERPGLVPKWTRVGILLATWFVVLGAGLTVSGSGPENAVALPADLLGVWRTVAPKYADSFLEISKRQLTFGTDDAHRSASPIDRVTLRADRRGSRYTIWYRSSEDPSTPQPFRLYYKDSQRRVWLESQQDIVWDNVGPAADLTELMEAIDVSSAKYEEQYGDLRRSRRSSRVAPTRPAGAIE